MSSKGLFARVVSGDAAMCGFWWLKRLAAVLFLCGLPVGGVEVMKWPIVEKPSNSPLQIEGLFVAEGGFSEE